MVVELTRQMPVLDAAIPVMKELAHGGKAEIVTSTQEEAVGLAVDVLHMARMLRNKHLNAEITKKEDGVANSFTILGKEGEGVINQVLKIEFNSGMNFDVCVDGSYERTTVLETTGLSFPSKIGVTARSRRGGERGLEEHLSDKVRLPNQTQNSSVKFYYMGTFPFEVYTNYQSFDALDTHRNNPDEVINVYPVSGFRYHTMDKDTWLAIEEPVFWDAWSQWHAHTIDVLTGKKSIEGIARRYGEDITKTRDHIKKGELFIYKLIELHVDGKGFDELCDQMGCPGYLRGIFLNKALNTFYFTAEADGESEYAKGLVDRYNEEYASSENGVEKITVRDLRHGKLMRVHNE